MVPGVLQSHGHPLGSVQVDVLTCTEPTVNMLKQWSRMRAEGRETPHSPLNWGRLFSLKAAKPSRRSLVGITWA